jgi:signal peptidase I
VSRKKKAEREHRGILRDYGLAIGGSILVALFIRFFVLEAYRMPSRAMQPTVEPGDTLFVAKYAYGFRVPGATKRIVEKSPKYGDVVVLEFVDEPGREYIKRVVALPGDRVQFTRGGLVLNSVSAGSVSPEAPKGTAPDVTASELCAKESLPNAKSYEVCFEPPLFAIEKEITVPPGQVYVVGDLRSMPFETRRLKVGGLVPIERVKGRALFVWLSIQPPGTTGAGGDWFSRVRFDRLFHKIR